MDIITLDCGASFLKGARFNQTGVMVQLMIEDSPQENVICEGKRIDRIVKSVMCILDKLTDGLDECMVCISNEMHGYVVTDVRGIPYTDYISWKNENAYKRNGGQTYLEILGELLTEDEILSTGMPIKAGLPNVNLFYALQNELRGISKEEIYFYTLGDYIIRVLSDKEPYIHITNAAATGLVDLRRRKWNESIIKKLGMDGIRFPSIYTNEEDITVNKSGVCMHFLPAVGDQQAALLGSNLADETSISVNLGTGGQVSRLTGQLFLSKQYQTRPFFNGLYLKTIPHIPSGRALNVYFGFVKEIVDHFAEVEEKEIWKYILDQVRDAEEGNLDIDMSFFTNAVTTHTQGTISGIREENFNCGNLFLSVYKQLAENVNTLLEKIGCQNIRKIIFSGGVATKNELLRQLILEKIERYESVFISENETMIGLFMYANMRNRG